MGLHKMFKDLGNKINTIQNFFATTTDYESRGQEFESSRAHHFYYKTWLILLSGFLKYEKIRTVLS